MLEGPPTGVPGIPNENVVAKGLRMAEEPLVQSTGGLASDLTCANNDAEHLPQSPGFGVAAEPRGAWSGRLSTVRLESPNLKDLGEVNQVLQSPGRTFSSLKAVETEDTDVPVVDLHDL